MPSTENLDALLAEARLSAQAIEVQRSQITTLQSANQELSSSITRYEHLLDEAQAMLWQSMLRLDQLGGSQTNDLLHKRDSTHRQAESWEDARALWIFDDSWLSLVVEKLIPIESMIADTEAAPETIWDSMISKCTRYADAPIINDVRRSVDAKLDIDAKLLRAVVKRVAKKDGMGLEDAESALSDANYRQLGGYMIEKAQFIRGTCKFALGCFRDAEWCFTLAFGHRLWRDKVMLWRERARVAVNKLPEGDSRRRLSPNLYIATELVPINIDGPKEVFEDVDL
ncbi:MAG: hypothetical protein M1814_000113 [Vezdaea aestivalis]|nr:MAG: hypothetical protein M1814_000113 [Vezdaea aestivalis]